jgi:L-aspartate oxidase
MAQTGRTSVGLDMRSIDPALFPNVVGALRDAGIDPATEVIPVAPAAHYMMGGILTDLQARSTVPGLYAVGESACTGLHGANRLASNSLSECFVFARRAAQSALEEPPCPPADTFAAAAGEHPTVMNVTLATRQALWREAGIERSGEGLQRLAEDPHPLARLIARCALQRTESRGAHRRVEYPDSDPALDHHHVLISGGGEPSWQTLE